MYRDLEKAAKNGNTYAMLSLAYCYQHGIYVEADPEQAIKWYKTSALKGCGRARWELAKFYHDGILVPVNTYEYIHWVTAASESGIPEAMVDLAHAYVFGLHLPTDLTMVELWLQRAADLEYSLAEFLLGAMYKIGYTSETTEISAEELWDRARQHGDAESFFEFGSLLEFGDGVMIQPDVEESLPWYKLSADMGSSKGYFSYMKAKSILDGAKPETKGQREAKLKRLPVVFDEMKGGALLNEADACMDAEDFEGALDKYKQSAELGNADAMFMLSLIYRDGELVKRNNSVAFDYLTRAAMCGNTDAQIHLARCYETGDGCTKDLNEAVVYYAMAIAGGNLSVYYQLTRYIEHPEVFVNKTRKVVR